MIHFSYTLSPVLKEHLTTIERLRAQILLTPLSPRVELRLRFESMIGRIYWSMSLAGNQLTKDDIETLLTKTFPKVSLNGRIKKLADEEKMVLRYKKALDSISHDWLVTPQPLRHKDLLELAEIVSTKQIKNEKVDLSVLLDYLHKSTDHPVVQAAIVQMQIITMSPFADGNGRMARLLALLFLYKHGYDFRGLLVLEEYWRRDIASLEVLRDNVLKSNSLNIWIEYFAQGMATQLEKTLQKIRSLAFQVERDGYTQLSDRQRAIISVLDFPQATITNKKVQSQFKVSQITASRDLSKLAILGLVVPHGKGRSVYYTRV